MNSISGVQRHTKIKIKKKKKQRKTITKQHTFGWSLCGFLLLINLHIAFGMCSAIRQRALYADDYGSNNGYNGNNRHDDVVEEKFMHWMVNFSRPTKWPRKHRVK